MATLKHTDRISGHLVAAARLAGSLVYTIFKVAAWTVGLGAFGFAVLFYLGGITELIGGAIQVFAATAIVYLTVTQIVNRGFLSVPASLDNKPEGHHKKT